MDNIVKMFNSWSDLPIANLDVHCLFKYAITEDDEETNVTFDRMEHLRMILYIIGSDQKQLSSLMRNRVEYSRKYQDPPAKLDFKINPNLKSL